MTGVGAYIEQYNQHPPDGAKWGVDVSWYQATRDGQTLSKSRCLEVWNDIKDWADWATIRTTYGRSGIDGAEEMHLECAREVGFLGEIGAYHYLVPSSGQGNASNYVRRWNQLQGAFKHSMLDHEEGLNYIAVSQIQDEIEQGLQLPSLDAHFYYTGKSVGDSAGWPEPRRNLWAAHYANGRYWAWAPTADWSLWQAPYVPGAWEALGTRKLIWQFTSSTSLHGSLDINITTTEEFFGLEDAIPMAIAEDILNTVIQLRDQISGLHHDSAAWFGVLPEGQNHWNNVLLRLSNLDTALGVIGVQGADRDAALSNLLNQVKGKADALQVQGQALGNASSNINMQVVKVQEFVDTLEPSIAELKTAVSKINTGNIDTNTLAAAIADILKTQLGPDLAKAVLAQLVLVQKP